MNLEKVSSKLFTNKSFKKNLSPNYTKAEKHVYLFAFSKSLNINNVFNSVDLRMPHSGAQLTS